LYFNETLGAPHREFMRKLRSECANDLEYHLKLADPSKVPGRSDFNSIYVSFNKSLYGTESLKSMFTKVKERIASLKDKDDAYIITLQEFNEEANQPFILTLITPLMKRVHKWVTTSCTMQYSELSQLESLITSYCILNEYHVA
jgi:hypothetical protein